MEVDKMRQGLAWAGMCVVHKEKRKDKDKDKKERCIEAEFVIWGVEGQNWTRESYIKWEFGEASSLKSSKRCLEQDT